MNLKRILAGVLACCVMGGALPYVSMPADNAVITTSAAGDEDYARGTYESLSYKNYGDYIPRKVRKQGVCGLFAIAVDKDL